MSFTLVLNRLRAKIAAYRRYRQLIAEIETLSENDLAELGVFQVDLCRAARKQAFG